MRYIKYITALLLCISVTACNFLDEYSQDTYYVTSYKDLDELLIGDCYMPVHAAYELYRTQQPGYFLNYLSDEIEEQNGSYSTSFDNKEKIFGYYTWQQRSGATANNTGYLTENGTWTEIYRLINVANNIIESAKEVPQTTEEEKQGTLRINGEAHFIRACYYFWLVNLYAKPYQKATASTDLGVPIKTNAEVNDIIYQRNTVQEVYDLVLSDLKTAADDLGHSTPTGSLYRADSTAVNLLLSRVYLYMQDWNNAVVYADKVLKAHPQLKDLNTSEDAFLKKDNPENIFSMGGSDLCSSISNDYQSFRASHDLYNAYADDDLRKSQWWWTYGDFVGPTKFYVQDIDASADKTSIDFYWNNYQYPSEGKLSTVSDRFLFRSAEAYLNKAEAEACLGNDTEARTVINSLRKARYKDGSDYELKSSGDQLLQDIRDERFRELAFEGHRWFDLRRYSVCEKAPWSKAITHDYTYYTDRGEETMKERHRFILEKFDKGYTLPIPHEVIDFNTGMPNNDVPLRTFTVVPLN